MKKKIERKTMPATMPATFLTKAFVIHDPIFKQQINVLINFDEKQYVKWLNRNKVKDVDTKNFNRFQGWVSDYETKDGRASNILFIPKFEWTIKHQGTLIHEIVHCVIKIWARNNIPFNVDTQEFLAHSIGNLYEDIARKLLVVVKTKI